ncbi:phosphonate metabolism protein/1,5-bisphosphokinase (PRPP-forming) PhnN [Rhodopseudomonas sp. RCAM05734]|uniref:phosphonate metabolism protein/1,5-bisphosphokinase (PRPP-forming) PhnN n=1 Tax=Rhodopseudomonas sp. RCAM05734 TaxID=3457549 RepID=UPI004044EC97
MTDTATISEADAAKIGPGRLVLVVGPSGAGKDTLIDLARAACRTDNTVVFARRVVTREASAFEDNAQATPDAFRRAVADGLFAIHWEAHGHHYALSSAIDDDIMAGRTVVANVSRTVIDALRAAYAEVVVVLITAPADVLAARLAARNRGSDGAPAARLGREVTRNFVPDLTINNVGRAEDHAGELVRIIRGE